MKLKQSIITGILIISAIFQFSGISANAENISEYKDGILSFQLSQSGSANTQTWIDSELTNNAGISSEWYILALSQSGNYNFSTYTQALNDYIMNNEIYSASTRLKYALVLASAGETNSPYITETLSNSIGQQGVMSWIYGLHVLNNGFSCEEYSVQDVISQLLSMQLNDNGWAVMGSNGDIDVTAMAIQALSPYYSTIPEVHQAIDNAVIFLSERQKDYGGYASFGTDNLESTAQVVTALSSIGIDSFSDERFIKDGHTLLDGMNRYRLPDGSYSHIQDGEMNFLATMQAFYTFVAYERFQQGKSPLYVLDAVQSSEIILDETIIIETVSPENHSPADAPEIINNSPENSEPIQQDDSEIMPETEIVNVSTIAPTVSNSIITTTATTANTSVSYSSLITATNTNILNSSTIITNTTLSTVISSDLQSSHMSTFPTTATEFSTIAVTSENSIISTSTAPAQNNDTEKISVRMIVMLSMLGCGLLASVILFALKKRSPKNFLFVGIVTAVGMSAVYFIRIQSADDYYSDKFDTKDKQGIVTISIRCDTLVGKAQSEYIPEDGIILDVTEVPITEGDTVYTVLTETVQAYHIQMEHKNNSYIAGINYLYELQYGDLSGWMYRVNGEFPSVGCNEYQLKNGDCIEWLYTCNIGNDLTEEESHADD